jgi:hypothetical protein
MINTYGLDKNSDIYDSKGTNDRFYKKRKVAKASFLENLIGILLPLN